MTIRLVNARYDNREAAIGELSKVLLPDARKLFLKSEEQNVGIHATCSKLPGANNNYECQLEVVPSNDEITAQLTVAIENSNGETRASKTTELKLSKKR
jgi:hypothetical protein